MTPTIKEQTSTSSQIAITESQPLRRSKRNRKPASTVQIFPDDRNWSWIDDVTAKKSLVALSKLGFVSISHNNGTLFPKPTEITSIEQEIDQATRKIKRLRDLHTNRKAINIRAQEAKVVLKAVLRNVHLCNILNAYILGDWELAGVQTIKVPAKAGEQKFHRDHRLGFGMSLVVALSVDKCPLRTLMIPGSHTQHSDHDYFTAPVVRY